MAWTRARCRPFRVCTCHLVVNQGLEATLGAGDLDLYQVSAEGSITSLVTQQLQLGRQIFSVAGPLNSDLVAGIGQAVQGAVDEYEVVEETEQLATALLLVMTNLDSQCRLSKS